MPKPRRIVRKLIATPRNKNKAAEPPSSADKSSNFSLATTSRKRTDLFNERVRPKNQRIGTQIETLDENVMESQISLFDDDEDGDGQS